MSYQHKRIVICSLLILTCLSWLLGFLFGAFSTAPDQAEIIKKTEQLHDAIQKSEFEGEQLSKYLKQINGEQIQTK
jgi:hypothetical protein